jgi:TPR repeat protein
MRMSEYDMREVPLNNQDEQTLYWLCRAADGDSIEAQRYLYRILLRMNERQLHSTFKTLSEAIKWVKIAANKGDPIAETDMGLYL